MIDEWFIRGTVPMTKSEVRAVSLSKLELKTGSVLWDIGAGTGSVAVEAAITHPGILVYAFEKKAEALSLIQQNKEKAQTGNLTVIAGTVPESFDRLAAEGYEQALSVTHVFIGGTSGAMEPVLRRLLALNPKIRIVINVIALESIATVLNILKELKIEAEIVSLQVSKAEKAGSYHLMKGQNPVYIISFGGQS